MKTQLLLVLSIVLASCGEQGETSHADYNVIPLPRSITLESEKPAFILNKSTKIVYPEGNEEQKQLASFFSDFIYASVGIKPDIATSSKEKNTIVLKTELQGDNPEAYKISITSDQILIDGASNAGLLFGIQTLRKSLSAQDVATISLPVGEINDYPEFKHRGAMLDVSRHFSDVNFVKKYIDVLALYNMNVFHWHLTDDQGWRIEIKKYPELTKVGSQRTGTAIDRHSEEYDGKPYGGFYTQDEIKDIIEYARQRYITVIPEIDIPGHALAILTSYPSLGCTGGPYQVGRGWGIFDDVLCAGNDSVYTFLEDVFSEVADLFPSQYIHIGGDECLKSRWEVCPKCQAKIKSLGIKADKEHSAVEQLQSYLIHRVEEVINKKGKNIIGWDEILEGGIAPNAAIMSWRGVSGGVYAAGKGHNVIMAPESHVYLDYHQSPDVSKEPYAFGPLTELKKTYSFDPLPKDLPAESRKFILGAQVNLWAEYMPTTDHVENMLLPRMLALAEIVWSYPQQRDYNNFVARLYKQSLLLDKLGYKNNKYVYGIQADYNYDTDKHEIGIALSSFDNQPIYYTLDGTEPSVQSTKYTDAIKIDGTTTLKAILYRDGQKADTYTRNFSYNKATVRPVELKYPTAAAYTFKGAVTLVDGLKGYKENYRTGSWQGFSGTDMEAIIKLDDQTTVSSVSFDLFENTRGLLFAPTALTIQTSDDGKTFRTVYTKSYNVPKEHVKPHIVPFEATFNEVKTNYVKVILNSVKTAPNWHEKKGVKTLLVIDEIVVE